MYMYTGLGMIILAKQDMIVSYQGPVVQRVGNAIHWINRYPLDSIVGFVNAYPLDSDLSCILHYIYEYWPLFVQPAAGSEL